MLTRQLDSVQPQLMIFHHKHGRDSSVLVLGPNQPLTPEAGCLPSLFPRTPSTMWGPLGELAPPLSNRDASCLSPGLCLPSNTNSPQTLFLGGYHSSVENAPSLQPPYSLRSGGCQLPNQMVPAALPQLPPPSSERFLVAGPRPLPSSGPCARCSLQEGCSCCPSSPARAFSSSRSSPTCYLFLGSPSHPNPTPADLS